MVIGAVESGGYGVLGVLGVPTTTVADPPSPPPATRNPDTAVGAVSTGSAPVPEAAATGSGPVAAAEAADTAGQGAGGAFGEGGRALSVAASVAASLYGAIRDEAGAGTASGAGTSAGRGIRAYARTGTATGQSVQAMFTARA